MHDPETYTWQAPYVSAILETDEDQMRGLLYGFGTHHGLRRV
jgi:hypothetical protein